jgi:hypothetical protein
MGRRPRQYLAWSFNGSISTSYEEGKKLQLDWRNLADEDAANAAAKEFVR